MAHNGTVPATVTNSRAAMSYDLPSEVTSHIISYIVADGLRISNDDEHNSGLTTIRSLLKTTKAIRAETMRQVFDKPLVVYITSKQTCYCDLSTLILPGGHTCSIWHDLELWDLPVHKWNDWDIHFDANPLELPDQLVLSNPSQYGRRESELAFRSRFQAATKVVEHYSECFVRRLDNALNDGCDPDGKRALLRYKFIFGTPTPRAAASGCVSMPLWTFDRIHDTLIPWRLFLDKFNNFRLFKLPTSIVVGIYPVHGSKETSPDRAAKAAELHRREFASLWSNLSRSKTRDVLHRLQVTHLGEQSLKQFLDKVPVTTCGNHMGPPVLRITMPESGVKDDLAVPWTGQVFQFAMTANIPGFWT